VEGEGWRVEGTTKGNVTCSVAFPRGFIPHRLCNCRDLPWQIRAVPGQHVSSGNRVQHQVVAASVSPGFTTVNPYIRYDFEYAQGQTKSAIAPIAGVRLRRSRDLLHHHLHFRSLSILWLGAAKDDVSF